MHCLSHVVLSFLRNKEVKKSMTHEEPLLTVREVARRLRVDDTTVRRWIKSGALEAITLPHRGRRKAYRIRQATFEQILSSPPSPEP